MTTPKKNVLPLFLAVTFGFSWGLWGLMIASQKGLLPFTVPTHWSGSFGPALGAIVAIRWSEGTAGLRSLGRRLFQWRAGLSVWVIALAGIVVAEAGALALFSWLSGKPLALQPFSGWASLLLYFPILLVIGGPLGEEIGWRGFLQPLFQSLMPVSWASALVGLVWVLWHVPLVWLEGAAQKGQSLLAFGAAVMPMAFIFAWVFNRSGGSLLLPLLLHTSINTVSFVVEPVVLGPLKDEVLLSRCFIAVLWIAAISLVLISRRAFFSPVSAVAPSDRSPAGP